MDTGECLEMDRFNNLDWPFQKGRIKAFVEKWDALLVMDATGVGDPIYDDLNDVLPRVLPVRFTPKTKTSRVRGLMVAVEQKKVRWPSSWEVLTAELKRYEYSMTAYGNVQYSAPSGYHDDCVMALALTDCPRYSSSCRRVSQSLKTPRNFRRSRRTWSRTAAGACPTGRM